MSKMKPCPFCGHADPVTNEGGDRWYITCGSINCFVAVGEGYDRDAMPDHQFTSEAAAKAAWNNRF